MAEQIITEHLLMMGIQGTSNLVGKGFRQLSSNHCRHCLGNDGACECPKGCKVKSRTRCSAVWKHCHHCRGMPGYVCTCPNWPPCSAGGMTECLHPLYCSICNVNYIQGTIFRCRQCENWGICRDCYENKGLHKHHSFFRIDWPGAPAKIIPAVDPNHVEHTGFTCDGCHKMPIVGPRYQCHSYTNFDLCQECYSTKDLHDEHHFRQYPTAGPTYNLLEPRAKANQVAPDRIDPNRDDPKPIDLSRANPSRIDGHHHFRQDKAIASSYELLEPRVDPGEVEYAGVACDGCLKEPIVGGRYKCHDCSDYDLCQDCYSTKELHGTHHFRHYRNLSTSFLLLEPRVANPVRDGRAMKKDVDVDSTDESTGKYSDEVHVKEEIPKVEESFILEV